MTTQLNRPTPMFDPARGLLNNDHFQIGYVTNDIDRAVAVFRNRFNVPRFRANDNALPDGGGISVRSAWVGAMMIEICHGCGPSMGLYTERAPPGGDFVLALHHFGYLVPDEAAWTALEAELTRGGWQVRSRSDIPGFFKGCYVAAPELGHYLEFVLPREGLLERLNATPAD